MRHLRVLLLVAAAVPVIACEVYTQPPPAYGAQVQVQTPPQPTAQVDVNAGDPNAQQAQVDPNAQAATDDQDSSDADPNAIDNFRQALAPYGSWVDDPQYGTIWFPSPSAVGGDFTPYLTNGHWVYDNDYTWVSDYDWGWAPFHYGRWFVYPGHGWAWIPGTEYAGAWVTWRNGDDGYGYVGWAPTPPSYYYRGGQVLAISTPWFEPAYTYAPTGDLFAPVIRDRVIRDPGRIREISTRTRVYQAPRDGFVNGSGGVRMRVRGPAPTRLGLNTSRLPHVPANSRTVVRAQEFQRTHPYQPHAVAPRTVTPTHPPIDRNNIQTQHNNETRNVTQTRPGNEATRTEPTRNEPARTEPMRTEPTRTNPAQVRTVPAPAPTPTNLRKPYPPPSVTHRR
ncbi:MAG TPA: DUF6600 domain-containing protein [Polyangiaceae bacterium]|jgi:hypothetical protein